MNKEALFEFLLQDLGQLKKDIEEKNKDSIENFFFYWEQHIHQLNKYK
tara:strand:+ start:1839 stop:1982 length:144 start_codon:yes stop_codon:yes gene_type:complete